MTPKERLLKMLQAKQQQRDTLNASMIECDSKEERAAIGETLKALSEEISEVEKLISEIDEPENDKDGAGGEGGEGGGAGRGMNPIAAMEMRNGTQATKRNKTDPTDTEDYRCAFMEFVCRGTPIPAELRADATTTTSDASAVIPSTIMNEIVKELKTYGTLWSRVRKLNVKGGVNFPVLSLKPTATWITANTSASESDKKKIQANTSVSFSYFGLECKVSQTLLTSVTTLEMFQQQFTELSVEAFAKALDIAIINGTGSTNNQPVGIATDSRVDSSRKVTMAVANVSKWEEWKKQVFAKIPLSYNNGCFIMAKGTWDGYIDGMVDSNGQPISRVNYGIDGTDVLRFGGKEVLLVENDVIKDWDTATGHASTGDVIMVYVDLKDYAVNSNLEMQTVKWIDHDKNEVLNKNILICDGKLIDPYGVVIVKKGA